MLRACFYVPYGMQLARGAARRSPPGDLLSGKERRLVAKGLGAAKES